MAKYTDGSPLTESGMHETLRSLKQATSVKEHVNPHAFRHHFACDHISNGGDISTLAKILRHTDLSTTAPYYAVFDEDELHDFHGRFTPMNSKV